MNMLMFYLPIWLSCFRGKRIPVSSLKKLEKRVLFPGLGILMDIRQLSRIGLGQEMGEPDRTCVPWFSFFNPFCPADPEFIGQMLLTMVMNRKVSFDVEPRNVLNRLWQQLRQRGLFPGRAVELEFYLLDRQRDAEGILQPPCAPGTDHPAIQSQVYSVDNLNHFADALNYRLTGAVTADSGRWCGRCCQFEINLYHTHNVLEAWR